MVTEDQIADDLYMFLTSEPQQNRFYWNKSVGLKSEIEFSRKCNSDKIGNLDRGMFLFRKMMPHHAIYVTVSKDKKQDYTVLQAAFTFNDCKKYVLCSSQRMG